MWRPVLLPTFHWPELRHEVTPDFQEGWEMYNQCVTGSKGNLFLFSATHEIAFPKGHRLSGGGTGEDSAILLVQFQQYDFSKLLFIARGPNPHILNGLHRKICFEKQNKDVKNYLETSIHMGLILYLLPWMCLSPFSRTLCWLCRNIFLYGLTCLWGETAKQQLTTVTLNYPSWSHSWDNRMCHRASRPRRQLKSVFSSCPVTLVTWFSPCKEAQQV